MNLALITPAAGLPVSSDEALAHTRASAADTTLIALYLAAAVQTVQDMTGRALLTETWRLSLPWFPTDPVSLPRAPLLGVTEIRYWSDATTPVDTVLASSVYQVLAPSGPMAQPGCLMLGPDQSWPSVQADRADAVRITFTAGYGASSSAVPAPLRSAVLLLVGSMYEFREADAARALTETPAVRRLLAPYGVDWL